MSEEVKAKKVHMVLSDEFREELTKLSRDKAEIEVLRAIQDIIRHVFRLGNRPTFGSYISRMKRQRLLSWWGGEWTNRFASAKYRKPFSQDREIPDLSIRVYSPNRPEGRDYVKCPRCGKWYPAARANQPVCDECFIEWNRFLTRERVRKHRVKQAV